MRFLGSLSVFYHFLFIVALAVAEDNCGVIQDNQTDVSEVRSINSSTRRSLQSLSKPGDNGSPSSAFPLQKCEGDCDNDGECDTGLKCYQRNNKQSVPGCQGSGQSGKDYCYDPSDGPSSPTPSAPPGTLDKVGDNGNPSSAFPLKRCEGDCDNDGECDGSLVCFQRSGKQSVPGCNGSGESGKDYWYNKSDGPSSPTPSAPSGTLDKVGDNGTPSSAFPLKRCQGDCDNDGECDGSLVCFQRSGKQSVPGCNGSGESGKDYCYNKNDSAPTPSAPTPSTVPPGGRSGRLRLYWQENYRWQESAQEWKFCMVSSSRIKVENCSGGNTRWTITDAPGAGSMIRIQGSNKCIERTGTSAIGMFTCDTSKTRQRWEAVLGSFSGSRFDIRPIGDSSRCLTQHHHPKPGETVFAETCKKAHDHTTGYWNFY